MSLDVYLTLPGPEQPGKTVERILVRRDGANVEITCAEWDELHPDREPLVTKSDAREVFWANVTHNLGRMAGEVGLYEPLWRPEEIGITHAAQLIAPLREGLARLRSEHERLQQFNPANGWGSYELLVRFSADYLAACERWPEAQVRAWR
jgi:hypothetical protein